MAGFDEILSTPAEGDALQRLRDASGSVDGPMERHCLRCRHLAARVAADRGWVLDGEVLTVAALLHDIGLYPPYASRSASYVADGAALAREMLPAHGWSQERITRCADAIDRHHELRGQLRHGAEVEALRRADLIDVSGGLVRFGVGRDRLAALRAEVPRRGLYREIGRLLARALRARPATVPRIFVRR
jgi:hypothetical protein